VAWGECPLPGTKAFEEVKGGLWHFGFQQQVDLPEALVAGREMTYLKSFSQQVVVRPMAISEADAEAYVAMYKQPGGMRCAFDVYRAFSRDVEENRLWMEREGKYGVPVLSLSGERSVLREFAERQTRGVYENVEVAFVRDSGHWCAEENPGDFVEKVLGFVRKH
jgi:pimeloyl-ACP methyl ester carboxylesterase